MPDSHAFVVLIAARLQHLINFNLLNFNSISCVRITHDEDGEKVELGMRQSSAS